jgi:hypothetical protein
VADAPAGYEWTDAVRAAAEQPIGADPR